MFTFSFDYSDYSLLLQSLLYHKFICESLLNKEHCDSDLYKMYSAEIKHIDSLLNKMKRDSSL